MIFTQEASEVLGKLYTWGNSHGYSHETKEAFEAVVASLAFGALSGVEPGSATTAVIVRTFVQWGQGRDPWTCDVVCQGLRECGLGEHIPPSSLPFDITVNGGTLRLELPVDVYGQPKREAVGMALTSAVALGAIVLTHVDVEASAVEGASAE